MRLRRRCSVLRFARPSGHAPPSGRSTIEDNAVTTFLSRRSLLQRSAALGLAAAAGVGPARRASAAEAINFATWSAAVDTVKSHVAAFEAKTGLKVNYT